MTSTSSPTHKGETTTLTSQHGPHPQPQCLVLKWVHGSISSFKTFLPPLTEMTFCWSERMWGLGYRLSSYLPFNKSLSWGWRERNPALTTGFEILDPAIPKASQPLDFPSTCANKSCPILPMLMWVDFCHLEWKQLWFTIFS